MDKFNLNSQLTSVNLELKHAVKIIEAMMNAGSKRNTVDIADLTIVSDKTPTPDKFTTFEAAIEHGTRLFDALYYFSLSADRRPPVVAATEAQIPASRKYQDISRALFYQLFLVLVRGAPNEVDKSPENEKIPNFLVTLMGLKQNPSYYAKMIASFSLSKIDWTFIKRIDFGKMDVAAINRVGLSVAGYRIMQPFKYYKYKSGASQEAIRAYDAIAFLAKEAPTWSVHPVTRSGAFTAYFGSFSKNVGQLILECFTDEQIDQMVNNKMLFARPAHSPQHTGWRTWDIDTLPQFQDYIFKKE